MTRPLSLAVMFLAAWLGGCTEQAPPLPSPDPEAVAQAVFRAEKEADALRNGAVKN